MTLRTFSVITVSKELKDNLKLGEYKIKLHKNLTEQEAKNYISIAIQREGFGVMMSRTNPSCYPAFNNLTKKICDDYIKIMNNGTFQQVMKMYDKLEKVGLKVGINF